MTQEFQQLCDRARAYIYIPRKDCIGIKNGNLKLCPKLEPAQACCFCPEFKKFRQEQHYPPETAERRLKLICLALNAYRDMLADVNDVEVLTPENMFLIAIGWINTALNEGILSCEEVKEALCGD